MRWDEPLRFCEASVGREKVTMLTYLASHNYRRLELADSGSRSGGGPS